VGQARTCYRVTFAHDTATELFIGSSSLIEPALLIDKY
jgi:hypothetical protein